MTAELYALDSPDAEDFVVCWLQPVIRASTDKSANQGGPFALVELVHADDCADQGTTTAVVQVGVIAEGAQATKRAARDMHRRMLLLEREIPEVVMSDGSTVNADYMTTKLREHQIDYPSDTANWYAYRYELGLSFVATT